MRHSRKILAALLGLLGILSLVPPTSAEVRFLGYTDVAGPGYNHLGEIAGNGAGTNVAFVNFAVDWTQTDLAAALRDFQGAGLRAALLLDNVLFRRFPAGDSSRCVDPQGRFVTRLRANWGSRLASFARAHGSRINPGTTLFIVVQTEVNNTCTALGDVEDAAVAIKGYFPGIPVVMGYGRSPGAQPAPASIPPDVDWVGFYKYGTYDPADPGHPWNADDQYLAEFQDLLGKLADHQRVLLGPDAFWATFLHAHLNSQNGPGTGWPRWYLQYVALNYERFALAQPKVVGMFLYRWSDRDADLIGTANLPRAVRARHQEIGCRNLGCP
ncbi:MAG TPA: hypothetical protein VGR07_17005 [Thermoanaerobaculia bacterium]|jgi:hypothetical protein|nr:hypothetical protein [Thermoanaerobaculia bacterium]